MIKKIFKRYDICFIIIFFILSIPAEYYEIFSLAEEQFISIRHSLRHHFGDLNSIIFDQNKIVLVTIDEYFLTEYNGFPLKRSDLAKIIHNINSFKPELITIDLLFKYSSSYEDDYILANALSKSNTVLASQLLFDEKEKFTGISYPCPILKENSTTGYVNIVSTTSLSKSISRLKIYPEAFSYGVWPFAVKTLSKYLNIKPELKDNILILGDHKIQLNQFNEMLIDFPPLPPNCKFLNELIGISAIEFLDISDIDDDELNELSIWIKDKIVILADITEESHDKFNTPVGNVFGSEIIADSIHTLINDAPLVQASVLIETLIYAFFMICIVLLTFSIQSPQLRALLLTFLLILYFLFCSICYIYYGIVISMTYTLLSGLAGTLIIFLRSYIIERKLKYEALVYQAELSKSYSRFVPHEYLGFLNKDSIVDVQLGDHISKNMAVMFSDIRSFTTISETMTPQENFDFVNAYLKRVSPIIRQQNGFIVKYLGDGMMAIFPDSPEDAIQAGLKKLNSVVEYNIKRKEKGRKPIKIGIGIHSGHMMVGMVGETARMQGDAFSDDVNLTARLEGLTKIYGVSMIISEAIYNQIKSNHEYLIRFLDNVKVKGKNKPIKIYEIFNSDQPEIKNIKIKTQKDFIFGQESFFQKNFDKAIYYFKKVIDIFPEDITSIQYLKRSENYLSCGICNDWDIADIKVISEKEFTNK